MLNLLKVFKGLLMHIFTKKISAESSILISLNIKHVFLWGFSPNELSKQLLLMAV